MRNLLFLLAGVVCLNAAESRQLFNGRDMTGWTMVGPGKFEIEDGMLKTSGGMGLLYYAGEKFGDQTIHVVFRTSGQRDNSGVYIRMPEAPPDPWYGVHNGYEVQIDSGGDEWHCTGAIYSLSKATSRQQKPSGQWNTMDIQLDGPVTRVFLNGVQVNEFGPSAAVPERKQWFEPVRGPRALKGYIGLQNHDGNSTVLFKEISVTPGKTVQASPGFFTASDRSFALSAFHGTRKQILDAVEGLTPAQWTWKAGPDRWSVAEVLEHLTLSEKGIFDAVLTGMKSKMPAPETPVTDEQVMSQTKDRSVKAQAPEAFVPKGQWKAGAYLVSEFKTRRDANLKFLLTTDEDLRGHYLKFGPSVISVYQGLLFLSAHSERHLQQLLEVKNSPGFPK